MNQNPETAVLGACLLQERIPSEVSGILTPQMFENSDARLVWEAMIECEMAHEPVSMITVASHLPTSHIDHGFLIQCIDAVPSSSGVIHYARVMVRKYIAKLAAVHAQETIAKLHSGSPVESILIGASQTLLELHHRVHILTENDITAFQSAEQQMREPASLIRLGFPSIDERIGGGLVRGELSIIAGRPGEGKTTLAISRLLHWASEGYKILVISKEMPKEILVYYLLSLLTQVPRQVIMQGTCDLEQKLAIDEALQKIKDEWSTRVIIVDDCWGMEECESLIRIHRPDIVIDDFIQLSSFKNRTEIRHEIESFLKMYKRLAKEFKMCPVVLSQLNRDLEKRVTEIPQLSDLAESGSLEQLAANVFFVQYPYQRRSNDLNLKNILEIVIGKARYGQRGRQQFHFIPELGAIIP